LRLKQDYRLKDKPDNSRNLYKRDNLGNFSLAENEGGVCMTSEKLMELLNKGIARELQVSIQYMWQHVLAKGVESAAVEDILKKIAITEMKHAEEIAERLAYLGGTPTTKPDPIFLDGSLREMLQRDLKAEEEAIALYKQTIKIANEEGDITTRRLFEEILSQEEGHHDTFTKLLEK
jgi:bacterioferritin